MTHSGSELRERSVAPLDGVSVCLLGQGNGAPVRPRQSNVYLNKTTLPMSPFVLGALTSMLTPAPSYVTGCT